MPREIERKFLVSSDGWRAGSIGSTLIRQGYLVAQEALNLRVRIFDDRDAVITIKLTSQGRLDRGEYEYPVPIEDARELLGACGPRLVEKRRHDVPFAGKAWIIDEFAGRHEGLLLAELELSGADENFEPPPWLGEEVTEDSAYSNAVLSMG